MMKGGTGYRSTNFRLRSYYFFSFEKILTDKQLTTSTGREFQHNKGVLKDRKQLTKGRHAGHTAGLANLFSVECQFLKFQKHEIFGWPRQKLKSIELY